MVNSVRIGDIDPACNGNAVFVSILGANGTVLTSAKADPFTAVAAGNSFPFAAQDPAKIEGIKIWIEGDK